ncbi:MAG: ABC transporter substrate-binding protein [Firmicutes bacterium]|nr:ABC transporter substrate-binding protein [Bacillota bacterium]
MKMSKRMISGSLLLLFMLLTACNSNSKNTTNGQEEPNNESAIALVYTNSFAVRNLQDGITSVTDGAGRTLLLVPEGQTAPTEQENASIIYTPVKKVIITAETQGALLRPLAALDSVVGYTDNINNWYIEELKEGVAQGRVTVLGNSQSPDFEKIKELQPDIVFLTQGQDVMAAKLDELGIPYVVDSSAWEADPMARMEWVKLFAAFYEQNEVAETFFTEEDAILQDLKEKIIDVERTSILWGFLIGGKAYVPFANSYVGNQIEMAGGTYVFKDLGPDQVMTASITLEEFYAKAMEADVYISSGPPAYHTSVQDIVERGLPLMATMKPLVDDNVWCYQPWYYQVIDETPAVIKELQVILYPQLYPDYKIFNYFYKVPQTP